MARPERNSVDYFPHEATHGKKMFYITQKYGNDGYATWFIILEKLSRTEYHYLNLSDDMQMMYLTAECRIDENKLKNILDDLAKFGAINENLWKAKSIIWCQKLVNSIVDAYNKRKNKCITLEGLVTLLKGLGVLNRGFSMNKVPLNPQTKVKETKVDKSIVKESKEDGGTSPLFKSMMEIYYNWFEGTYKMKPQIDGGDGKALKKIINYFRLNCKDDIIIIDSWKVLFEHWNKLSKFYKEQNRLRQIGSNIQNIVLQLKTNLQKNDYREKHPELFNADGSLKYGF